MPDKTRFPSEVGDAAPPCYGVDAEGNFYTSEIQYGRPAVMILLGAEVTSALPAILAELTPCQPLLAASRTDVFVIVDDNPRSLPNASQLWGGCEINETSDGSHRPLTIRAIDCGGFLTRCGVGPRDTLMLILDRNLRIAMRAHPIGEPRLAATCLACLDALPVEQPRNVATPAPAIVLPNLLPPSMCRDLIALFDSSRTIDGSVARVDAAGLTANVVDHDKKHRRDLRLDPDSPVHATLRDLLLCRCAPEIAKAFQVRVAFTDRILLARYDGPTGLFRRHRDNTAGHVAFREFALSVNLNAGDYQGGHLLFPEYNDHRYAPPTGGGVIFSASVLHEVAPITAGSRYVLLTFLHGQHAEQRRLAQASG